MAFAKVLPFASRLTLRQKFLIGLLVTAIAPLSVYTALSFTSTSDTLHRQARAQLTQRSEAVVQALADNGRAVVDQVVSNGDWAPFCAAIARRDLAWIKENVTGWISEKTALKGTAVLSLKGRSILAGGEYVGVSLSDRPVVMAAARQGRNSSDIEAVNGRLYIVGAGPVIDSTVGSSHRYGVVVFGEPIAQQMLSELAHYTGASDISLYVDEHRVASSAGRGPLALPPTAKAGVADSNSSTTTMLTELRNSAGKLQGYVRLSMTSSALGATHAELSKAAAYALLAALVICLLIGLTMTRALSLPLRRLAGAATSIAGGHTNGKLEVTGSDELGELAAAFNSMAEQIDHRLRENADAYAALDATYLETVTALAAAMEAKDHYTADHAESLAAMALAVGRRLGLTATELRELNYAAVLHDIGKIGIPGHILNKPEPFDDGEFAVMAEHTIIGERIISEIEHLRPVARIVRSAHERWDGKGYPDGLAGEQIPLAARIVFVCDAYHAMTSNRPYRDALPAVAAVDELYTNAGEQFDPAVVAAFIEVVAPLFDEEDTNLLITS